jgi:hypothetical protein
MFSATENFFLSILTQSVAFWYTDFYTTLYFVNQRNYKTLGMQAHTLTRARYFYILNVIISHPIVHKEGLGYLSVCAIASRSSPPTHVGICNGHPGSELFCVHRTRLHHVTTHKNKIRTNVYSATRTNVTITVIGDLYWTLVGAIWSSQTEWLLNV